MTRLLAFGPHVVCALGLLGALAVVAGRFFR